MNNRKIEHYQLVCASSAYELSVIVNEHIEQGYELGTSSFPRGDYLYQSIIKYESILKPTPFEAHDEALREWGRALEEIKKSILLVTCADGNRLELMQLIDNYQNLAERKGLLRGIDIGLGMKERENDI